MNPFSFSNKTTIHFGEGQIKQLKEETLKTQRVLLVYGGGSIKKNGVYAQVIDALSEKEVIEFSGIRPNPSFEQCIEASKLAKDKNVDFILAVGGGSVIDASKFIAAATLFEAEDPWTILSQQVPVKKAIDLGCVLTLPATGSESNPVSVISKGHDKLHFFSESVRPKFAILDPKVTLTLDERQMGNGVVDAFVHVIEQYLTYPVNALVQDRFSEGLLRILMQEGPKIFQDPKNLNLRANLMWTATMALNGLIGVGVPHDWSTHMIGHELTALYGVDHARSLSMVLPSLLRFQRKNKEDKLKQFSKEVLRNETLETEEIILEIENFLKQMKVPTSIWDSNIKDLFDMDTLISNLKKHHPYKLGERGDLDSEQIKEILYLSK